jgi:hypothetical protein
MRAPSTGRLPGRFCTSGMSGWFSAAEGGRDPRVEFPSNQGADVNVRSLLLSLIAVAICPAKQHTRLRRGLVNPLLFYRRKRPARMPSAVRQGGNRVGREKMPRDVPQRCSPWLLRRGIRACWSSTGSQVVSRMWLTNHAEITKRLRRLEMSSSILRPTCPLLQQCGGRCPCLRKRRGSRQSVLASAS